MSITKKTSLTVATETIICKKCQTSFEAANGTITQSGTKHKLVCPVCQAFVRFLSREIKDPGSELIYGNRKFHLKTIRDVYKIDKVFVIRLAERTGRPANAARLFLQQIQQG